MGARLLQNLIDADIFSEIARIERSLLPPRDSTQPRSCTMALAWCSENKAALRKIKVSAACVPQWSKV
jgi:macrophage erythroblast attacher